jgi:hypothetical protein
VAAKEAELLAKQAELFRSSELVEMKSTEVLQKEIEVLETRALLMASEIVVRNDLNRSEALEKQLQEKEAALSAKELTLTRLQEVLQGKDDGIDVLKAKDDALVQKEMILEERHGELELREAKVAKREQELDELERKLTDMEQQLTMKERSLETRGRKLNEQEDRLTIEEDVWKQREAQLKQKTLEINEKVDALNKKEEMFKRRGMEEVGPQPPSSAADATGTKVCLKAPLAAAPRILQPKSKVLPKASAPQQPSKPPPKELLKSEGGEGETWESPKEEGSESPPHRWEASPWWKEGASWEWPGADAGWDWSNKRPRSSE